MKVCVSRNLDITAGVLGIEPWSLFRHVTDVTATASGDGPIGRFDTLPGHLLLQMSATYLNNTPVPLQMVVRIQRGPRSIFTSNPNVVQIRDRWTWKNSAAALSPDYPNPSVVLQSQNTLGIDLSTNVTTLPNPGVAGHYTDISMTEDLIPDLLLPGETIVVLYAAFVWTPPPFSDNGNAGFPFYYAAAGWARVQLMSIPAQDAEVITG